MDKRTGGKKKPSSNPRPQSSGGAKPQIHGEKVVALKYEKGDAAPKVVAKGSGYVAEKILSEAKNAAVPIHEDAPLVAALNALDLGDMIPDELFRVISEVYIFVDKIDAILGGKNSID